MAVTKKFQWSVVPLAMLLLIFSTTAAAMHSLRRLVDLNKGPYRPTCYAEHGFDYEGFDLQNVPSTSADNCCGECAKVGSCRAWSWSPYRNGTCWLKSARGTIRVDAAVTSSLLFDGYRTSCEAAQDVDFVGNDIGHAASVSVTGCCELCRNFLGCRAYSWSDYAGGTCWFKSAKGVAVVKTGVQSAQAYLSPAYESVCALAYDVDIVGNDLSSAPSATPTGCCAICLQTNGCHAFAWTNQSGGTCYLKSFSGPTIQKSGVVSSVVFPNADKLS